MRKIIFFFSIQILSFFIAKGQEKVDSVTNLKKNAQQNNAHFKQQNNALPYLHCPLQINFNPYDSSAGYMMIYFKNKKLYIKAEITYPQYHLLIYEACDWPKDTFRVELYTKHGFLLNKFQIRNPPVTGQIGNFGEIKDMRKKHTSRRK